MNPRQFLGMVGIGAGLTHLCTGHGAPPVAPRGPEARPEDGVVSAPFSPVRIGTSAQLFVERSIVRHTDRVWFTMRPGKKHPRNPLIRADRDWQGWCIKTYGNAILDEDEKVFKVWYESEPPSDCFPGDHYAFYAVSKNGVEWEKALVGTIRSPKLGSGTT